MRRSKTDDDRAEGAMWRDFGLRKALANMPADSPGRGVIQALLARGSLTEEEGGASKHRAYGQHWRTCPRTRPGAPWSRHCWHARRTPRQHPLQPVIGIFQSSSNAWPRCAIAAN